MTEVHAVDGFFSPRQFGQETHDEAAIPLFLKRFELAPASWSLFMEKLDARAAAPLPSGVTSRQLKVLFLLRHAEGTHNVAEATMGTPEWDAHGSLDPKYLDADLTERGMADAVATGPPSVANERARGMPAIERVVTSPHSRAIQTALLFFTPTQAPRPFLSLELCRETMGVHTCDQRLSVTTLRSKFPDVDFSLMETEPDTLWSKTYRETERDVRERAQAFLQQLFAVVPERVVVVSSHSGFLSALWSRLQPDWVYPANCEVLPLVVEQLQRD